MFNGKLRFNEDQMDFPRSVAPAVVMVLPHGDLFHENAPDSWLDRVFNAMEENSHHAYMVLTKRSERMISYLRDRYQGLQAPPHIVVGVSVERQREADRRIVDLLNAPVQIRYAVFFSLVGPIDVASIADEERLAAIRQVMIGGPLTDPAANADWYANIRDYFDGLGVLVTEHVLAEEVERRGF